MWYVESMSRLFLHKFLGVRLDVSVTFCGKDLTHDLIGGKLVSFLF